MQEYSQPSVEILGLVIYEPVTVLTDLLITAVCFYGSWNLRKLKTTGPIRGFLVNYMWLMGLATAIGGIVGHGLMHYLDFFWKTPGWLLSMLSIALFERAAIFYARPLISPRLGVIFGWINVVELITFIVISFTTLNFWFVQIHAAYGLVVVVSAFSFLVVRKKKDRGSMILLFGVGWSTIAAVFYFFKWGLGPWFTHYDMCHVFMAISSLTFYFGARRILMKPFGFST